MPSSKHVSDAELIERIKSRVKISDTGCWEYQGPDNGLGYRQASLNGKRRMVHRAMYELTYSMTIHPKLVVCHTCDNPACCNPDHLWIGTEKQNMGDAADKQRWSRQRKTHCVKGHEFTPENTSYKVQRGRPCRICKECARIKGRLYWASGAKKAAQLKRQEQDSQQTG